MNEQRTHSDAHSENREVHDTLRRFLNQYATEAKVRQDLDSPC
jgi:hypothetical protein